MKVGRFFSEQHKKEFYALLIQADIIEEQDETLYKVEEIQIGSLLSRQVVFFYLIALYQEDFLYYEGEKFWVEAYEDISLDGPVYLLDEEIGTPKHDYEWAIHIGKQILIGMPIDEQTVPQNMKLFIEEIIYMLNLNLEVRKKA